MIQAPDKLLLHHVEGPKAGEADAFNQPSVVVGRAPDCHLSFATERGVSGHHAEFRRSTKGFELVDLNSTNGTFVNDERVQQRELNPGDLVRFGYMGPVVKVEFDLARVPDAHSTMYVAAAALRQAAAEAAPVEAVAKTMPPPSREPAPLPRAEPPRPAPPPPRPAPTPPAPAPVPAMAAAAPAARPVSRIAPSDGDGKSWLWVDITITAVWFGLALLLCLAFAL
jgi:predicted component of type VI protein secretion system